MKARQTIDQFVQQLFLDQNMTPTEHADLQEEIRGHLLETVQELLATGMEEQAAIALAIERYGDDSELDILPVKINSKPRYVRWLVITLGVVVIGSTIYWFSRGTESEPPKQPVTKVTSPVVSTAPQPEQPFTINYAAVDSLRDDQQHQMMAIQDETDRQKLAEIFMNFTNSVLQQQVKSQTMQDHDAYITINGDRDRQMINLSLYIDYLNRPTVRVFKQNDGQDWLLGELNKQDSALVRQMILERVSSYAVMKNSTIVSTNRQLPLRFLTHSQFKAYDGYLEQKDKDNYFKHEASIVMARKYRLPEWNRTILVPDNYDGPNDLKFTFAIQVRYGRVAVRLNETEATYFLYQFDHDVTRQQIIYDAVQFIKSKYQLTVETDGESNDVEKRSLLPGEPPQWYTQLSVPQSEVQPLSFGLTVLERDGKQISVIQMTNEVKGNVEDGEYIDGAQPGHVKINLASIMNASINSIQ